MVKLKKIIYILFISSCFHKASSQQIIFYLPGKIVENQGAKAFDTMNGYGAYLYDVILDSLKKRGATVLSDVRSKDTDVKTYALKIKKEIDSLLKTGIKPEAITVIGASKGASIAMYVSTFLKNKRVNFVFMAACYQGSIDTELNCYGNILSIYEASDQAGSCNAVILSSKGLSHFKELKLNTGLKHGFLYKPLSEWIEPCLQWSMANYN